MVSAISNYAAAQSTILQGLQIKYAKTDANSDGLLGLAEFQSGGPQGISGTKQEELFNALDTDSDGYLTENEFTSGFESRPPPPTGGLLSSDVTQQLREMFQSVDADSDGGLSLDEFSKGAQDKGAVESSEKIEEVFSALDTDDNGALSEDEFTAALSGGPGGPGGPPPGGPPPGGGSSEEEESSTTVYDSRDTNEDGVVSVDEILAAQTSEESENTTNISDEVFDDLLNAFDQDEDGQVTKEEASAGFDSLRKATLDFLISLQGEEQQAAA